MAVMLMLGYVDLLTYFWQMHCSVCLLVTGAAPYGNTRYI